MSVISSVFLIFMIIKKYLYLELFLLVYGISLIYGPPCALCEEIMKFGTDDL